MTSSDPTQQAVFHIVLSTISQTGDRSRMPFRLEPFNTINKPEFNNPRDPVDRAGAA